MADFVTCYIRHSNRRRLTTFRTYQALIGCHRLRYVCSITLWRRQYLRSNLRSLRCYIASFSISVPCTEVIQKSHLSFVADSSHFSCSSLPLLWDADRTQTIHKVFMVCLQFLGVFVPYFFIIFAYVRIFRQVRRSLAMRKDLESRRERKNERERNSSDFQVAKVFFTVSIIFLFSWLPIIYMTTSKIILNRPEVIPEVLPTVSLFTVATSSLVNPLIYAFLKPDFKVVLRNFCRKSSQHAQGEAVSLRPNIPSPSCHLGIEQNTKHHDQTMGRKTEDIPTDSHAGILCVVDVHKI